jgi:hypothetical protein
MSDTSHSINNGKMRALLVSVILTVAVLPACDGMAPKGSGGGSATGGSPDGGPAGVGSSGLGGGSGAPGGFTGGHAGKTGSGGFGGGAGRGLGGADVAGSGGGAAGRGGEVSGPSIYVDATAANDSGTGTSASPKKYIPSGIALLPSAGGGRVVVRPGTYGGTANDITTLKAGVATAWNVIKAETDGTVTITSELQIPPGTFYTRFEGLRWSSHDQKSIAGRYLKFFRTAFEGGPTSGNSVSVAIGTNDATPGAEFVLLEDCWVYGLGGRYKVLIYNAQNIVLRRVVGRHDGGWSYDQQNPQGVFSVYESRNVRLQNCLSVDPAADLEGYEADYYGPANSTTSTPYDNDRWQGCMSFDGPNNAFAIEGPKTVTNCSVEDFVSYNTAQGIAHNGSGTKTVTYDRITKIGGAYGFARWAGEGAMTVTNSILEDSGTSFQAGASNGGFNNTFGSSSGGAITSDPKANGLLFPLRIEVGGALKTAGSGGGQVGAEITKRIGTSGALFGEPGFESVTTEDLWPWPNEGRLQSDMAAVSARGFCAPGERLTSYLFERLGHTSPY